MSLPTHCVWVPELSSSRYLCTSKTRFVGEPSGLLTFARAAAEPEDTKDSADV